MPVAQEQSVTFTPGNPTLASIVVGVVQPNAISAPDAWILTTPAGTGISISRADLVNARNNEWWREWIVSQMHALCLAAGLDVRTATFAQIQQVIQAGTIAMVQ